jgi:hypothetical protein
MIYVFVCLLLYLSVCKGRYSVSDETYLQDFSFRSNFADFPLVSATFNALPFSKLQKNQIISIYISTSVQGGAPMKCVIALAENKLYFSSEIPPQNRNVGDSHYTSWAYYYDLYKEGFSNEALAIVSANDQQGRFYVVTDTNILKLTQDSCGVVRNVQQVLATGSPVKWGLWPVLATSSASHALWLATTESGLLYIDTATVCYAYYYTIALLVANKIRI